MTPPDKITVTQAWLYEHDEFGRQVHGSRWGTANGGSFDDFVGWRETQLVCRRAATAPLLDLIEGARADLSECPKWLQCVPSHEAGSTTDLLIDRINTTLATLAKLRDEIAREEG